MMYLEKNSENISIIELTLVSSLLNPFYLFEMISEFDSSSITYFSGDDLSNFKNRYNRFNIILSGASDVNLTASTIDIRSGSYTFNVYEASALTLSKSATTGNIIYNDLAIVNGEDIGIAEIYR